MTSTRTRAVAALAAAVALTATLTACGNGAGSSPVAATPSNTTATPTPTPTVEPVSILSGRPGPNGPVLALKVENTLAALPHIGLTSADVVYVQQVEGGLTRLAAIYSSDLPKVVAPIRSARETDAELLPMYGEIAFGFSGSVASVHRLVTRAGLVDVSADVGGKGYYRLSTRNPPHNMATVPATLIKRADGSVLPRDVGFTFGDAPAGGTPADAITAMYPAARIGLRYEPATQKWAYSLSRQLDRTNAEGTVAATTVIVQSVKVDQNVRNDVRGSGVPLSHTVGSGKATVFRDGQSWPLTWSRASVNSPTRWLYNGTDFPMKAGQIWVLLLNKELKPKITRPASATPSATPSITATP